MLLWLGVLAFERCIKETAKYCSQRKIFGKSVLDNQVVHYRLAELETEVELLRSLLYRATGLYSYITPLRGYFSFTSGYWQSCI